MAALAYKKRKCHLVVADTAKLAAQYFVHRHRICAAARDENSGMAVAAIEPFRVLQMRESDVGHVLRVGKQDIHVHNQHFALSVQARARCDQTLIQGFYPIDLQAAIDWKFLHGHRWVLQNSHRIIAGIMRTVVMQSFNGLDINDAQVLPRRIRDKLGRLRRFWRRSRARSVN